MPDPSIKPVPYLRAELAASCKDDSYVVIVRTSEEFHSWLHNPQPGAELLQVEGLINDPEPWAVAAQGTAPIPLDVVLDDPASEFSSLYRLVDVRNVRSVRVTIPAKPGFMKALRLATSLQIPVRILPGQPTPETLSELTDAADFYLRSSMVDVSVEFFHSLFARFCHMGDGTIWNFLDQDPADCAHCDEAGNPTQAADFVKTHLAQLIRDGGECATCPWQKTCAGYFKHPAPEYDCSGVKELFATLESAATELLRDLAHQEPLTSP